MSSSRSKRRPQASKVSSSLAQLRENKRSGKTRLEQYEAEDAEDLYDEIDTEDRVFKRLRQDHDDFVEDDDGQGYADNGEEEEAYYSDEYPKEQRNGKGSKKNSGKISSMGVLKPEKSGNIKDAFMKAAESRPKASKVTMPKPKLANDDYLSSILEGLNDPSDLSPTKILPSTPVKKTAVSMNTPTRTIISKMNTFRIKDEVLDDRPTNLAGSLDDFPQDTNFDDFGDDFGASDDEALQTKQEIKKEPMRNPFLVDDQDDALEVREVNTIVARTPKKYVNSTSKQEKATVVKKSEQENRQNWMTVDSDLNITATYDSKEPEVSMDVQELNILEDDGTLRMYWTDACEVRGVVYIFGKVLQRTTNKYISCCVTVQNIERNLFLLPRPRRVDKQGNIKEEIDISSVYEEFDEIRQAYKIPSFLSKPVERNYAFELPDVPSTGDYLKVVYPYSAPSLPIDLKGETFSHVFGANTSALEHFIIKRNLMGPCWLEIKETHMNATKISWCKSEFTINNPKHIVAMAENSAPPAPPLCIMSLSMRTIIDTADKSNEIVSAATSVYHEVRLDDAVETNRKIVSKEILIRKLKTSPFPPGFDSVVERSQGKITKVPSEQALLNRLLIRINNTDPDVIVGHNFVGFDLDVLLHRMKHNKTHHWSRIGRLRRTVWPKLQSGAGGMGDTTAAEKQVMAGRLMCDTYLGAKEHVRSKSYSLTQLVAMQLGINRDNIEYEKIKQYFNSSVDLERMLRHSDFDTYLCIELMFNLQLLPLSRQLTALSGNLWSITLTAGRAVRNEYLLLHEFHRNKYICPDKAPFSKGNNGPVNLNDGDDQDEELAPKKGTRKKPQYAGGLVLEPKKGFYDTFVLLLDFNSLYPSIIQEYNICFTTVKYNKEADSDQLPEYPEEGLPVGILPRLLENLVSRRREVKKLMKNASGTKYAEV
ncbi:DNA polymerase alpha catalytic subunit [Podila humilis]|nr:DNA polymerase alpha catalytic subunit [Podila humilis]